MQHKLLDGDASDAENNGEDSIRKVVKRKVASTFSKDNYGCSNWQPSDFTQGETEASQEFKRSWSVAEFGKPVMNRDKGKVKKIMVETYGRLTWKRHQLLLLVRNGLFS